jgi:hypothetical protein
MPRHTAKGGVLKESKGPKATEYQQNGVVKPVAVTAALLILSGAAAGIQPAGVENVTLQLNFNASEVYRSGTQTTPGEYNPSSYPYLSSNKPEALVPYGDTEELTNIYMADGLVAYYPLDETTGNTANDITTTLPDNDGTHVNFDGDELGAPGNLSTGYNLSSGAFINESADSYLLPNLTVSLWFKPKSTPSSGRRLVYKNRDGSGWSLSYGDAGSGTLRFLFQDLDTVSLDTGGVVDADRWHHVVAVRDGTRQNRYIYLNSTRQAALTSDTGVRDTNTNLVSIGAENDGSRSFDGTIDDVRIYNRSLSQQEIERLYNYSRGQPGTEQISATISSGGFLVASTKGGTPSIESRREAVNSRSLLGRIDPSFGFNPSRTSPTTNIVYRSPYNLTGDSFSSASSGIVLRNTAGLGDNATVSVAPIG